MNKEYKTIPDYKSEIEELIKWCEHGISDNTEKLKDNKYDDIRKNRLEAYRTKMREVKRKLEKIIGGNE